MANKYIGTYRGTEVWVIAREKYFDLTDELREDPRTLWTIEESGQIFYQGKYFGRFDQERKSITTVPSSGSKLNWQDCMRTLYDEWRMKQSGDNVRRRVVENSEVLSGRPTVEAFAQSAPKLLELLVNEGQNNLEALRHVASDALEELLKYSDKLCREVTK